ncbi:hypothetical protein PC119_g15501 [Phytophthora cactorum]|nr:hypothetical protein PC119_g15501 [Phytophthora cactorum]
MRGEIECKAPGLTPFRQRALDRLRSWSTHELLHVKREWNQSADQLELLLPKDEELIARVAAATRSQNHRKVTLEVLQSAVVQ